MSNDKKTERIRALWEAGVNSENSNRKYKNDCEDYFYADVENTNTEFTHKQTEFIKATYNLPVSVKYTYPICQKLLSFLTSGKPRPSYISSSEQHSELAYMYEGLFDGVWSESRSDGHLQRAVKDAIITGEGFMKVRENAYTGEYLFNVAHEYVSWRKVLCDPQSERPDMSDAEWICISDRMTADKAERVYDIKLPKNEGDSALGHWQGPKWEEGLGGRYNNASYEYRGGTDDTKKRWVWVREWYEKKEKSVWISEEGQVSTQRPKPKDLPNERRLALQEQLQEAQMQLQQALQSKQQSEMAAQEADPTAGAMQGELQNETRALEEAITGLKKQIGLEPKTVAGFEMELENGDKVDVYEIVKNTRKMVLRAILVGDNIVEEKYFDTDIYPIVRFCYEYRSPQAKTYGLIHYIKDHSVALNKILSEALYDMTLNRTKVIAAKGSIVDEENFENRWTVPGSVHYYEPNPSLPDGGRPTVMPTGQLNPSVPQLAALFLQMIEYTSGIQAAQMEGQQENAELKQKHEVESGGTQRVKMVARNIEAALENLGVITKVFLQEFAPREKLFYIDANGDKKEAELIEHEEGLDFKVRVDIIQNMPTIKQEAAKLLGAISGQTRDPQVANLLVEMVLKMSDLPEVKEVASKIDQVKQMQGQLQSLQSDMEEKDNLIKAMKNNMTHAEIGKSAEVGKAKMEGEIALEKEQRLNENGEGDAPQELIEEEAFNGF